MAERRSIFLKKMDFAGIFNIQEVYSLISDFFQTKEYERWERLNEEVVDEEGRQVIVKLFPSKQVSDYMKVVMKVIFQFRDVKDVVIEVDGKKRNMHKGKAKVSIEAYMETDHEGKMNNSPFYFFVREFFDRFFYRSYVGKAEKKVISDAEQLLLIIKRYFNMTD